MRGRVPSISFNLIFSYLIARPFFGGTIDEWRMTIGKNGASKRATTKRGRLYGTPERGRVQRPCRPELGPGAILLFLSRSFFHAKLYSVSLVAFATLDDDDNEIMPIIHIRAAPLSPARALTRRAAS